MLANDYILPVGKGKFKLSTKFHQHYSQLPKEVVHQFASVGMQVRRPDVIQVSGHIELATRPALANASWEEEYKSFIICNGVPKRLETQRGESYPANTYSEAGMRAYRKAIEQGYDMILLGGAIRLYYKSNIKFKMAIGRFMEEGHWKTYYDELKAAAEQGVDAVNNLVTEQTKDNDVDHYELG